MSTSPSATHRTDVPTTSTAYIAQRPKRADGKRNYDAILTEAMRAFHAHGAEASLEDIATKAGVAIGTLYRHFPTRASLVEAATREGLATLVSDADRQVEPWPALLSWMRRAIKHFSTFRGLVTILAESMYDEGTPSHSACQEMHNSGAALLAAAQGAGAVRADLTSTELFDMLSAAAWLCERADHERADRLIQLIVEGIATR